MTEKIFQILLYVKTNAFKLNSLLNIDVYLTF